MLEEGRVGGEGGEGDWGAYEAHLHRSHRLNRSRKAKNGGWVGGAWPSIFPYTPLLASCLNLFPPWGYLSSAALYSVPYPVSITIMEGEMPGQDSHLDDSTFA